MILFIFSDKRLNHTICLLLFIIVIFFACRFDIGTKENIDNANPPYNVIGILDDTFGDDNEGSAKKGFFMHHSAAGGDLNDYGEAAAIDSNGRIIVAGYSTNEEGNLDIVIWRLTSNGKLDTTFGEENGPEGRKGYIVYKDMGGGVGHDHAMAIAIDKQNEIIIAGSTPNLSNDLDIVVLRLLTDGTLDNSFGDDDGMGGKKGFFLHNADTGATGEDRAHGIAIDSQDKILISGYTTNSLGNRDFTVWRFNPNGELDFSFGDDDGMGGKKGYFIHHGAAGGNGWDLLWKIILDSHGSIFITGESLKSALNRDMVLMKLTPDGELDTTFGDDDGMGGKKGFVVHGSTTDTDKNEQGRAIAIDSQERIYVTGYGLNSEGNMDMVLWRYTSNGMLDTTFGDPDGELRKGFLVRKDDAGAPNNDYGTSILIDNFNRPVVAGLAGNITAVEMAVWRFTQDGVLDTTFGDDDGMGGRKGFLLNSAGKGTGSHWACEIIKTSGGKYVLTGVTSTPENGLDMIVWRIK